MRKVLLTVSAIAILTASFAAMAAASETSWVLQIIPASGGSAINKLGSGSVVWAATTTSSGVQDDAAVKDAYDGTPLPPGGQPVALAAWYRPGWGGGTAPMTWALTRDFQTPLQKTGTNVEVQTWSDLIVWAADGYTASDIHLFVYTPSAAVAPPTSVAGSSPITYKLVMTHSPASYVGQREWIIPVTSVSGATQFIDISLPAAGAIGSNPISGTGALSATQEFGYRFNLVTPEPGSLLVLASGLTGLVGFAARRRKS